MGNATLEAFEVKKIATWLKQSAVFNVSLSNKELFHSNFLAWLCERIPTAPQILFGPEFGGVSSRWGRTWSVRREEQNLDLVIELGDSQGPTDTLVIENKVKSVPGSEQLVAYRDAVKSKPGQFAGQQHFLLLTLDPDDVRSIDLDQLCWSVMGYGELAKRLHKLPHDGLTPYHIGLIDDYANVVQRLAELARAIGVSCWGEPPPEVRELRLHDLILKRCAAHVGDQLLKALGSAFPHAKVAKHGGEVAGRAPGDIYVYDGMNRAKATVGCYSVLPTGADSNVLLGLGFQVEGGQFRSYVEVMPKDPTSTRNLDGYAQRATTMFERSPCVDWWATGVKSAGRKIDCRYGNRFTYRYQTLKTVFNSTTPDVESMVAEIVKRMLGVERHAAELAAQWSS